jgi:hypothetical protein
MSVRLGVVVHARIKQPHGRMWWYGTSVISMTMTVCPTSGSQAEGYNPLNTGLLERKMGDWTGVREVGYRTTRGGAGPHPALLAACVEFAKKWTAWIRYVLVSRVSTGIILEGQVYIDIKVGRVRDSANRHKSCVCVCNSNLSCLSHSMRRENGHVLDIYLSAVTLVEVAILSRGCPWEPEMGSLTCV